MMGTENPGSSRSFVSVRFGVGGMVDQDFRRGRFDIWIEKEVDVMWVGDNLEGEGDRSQSEGREEISQGWLVLRCVS